MILRLLMTTILLTSFTANVNAWTIGRPNSCDKVTVKLELPALDLSCDLDDESGNPSKWLNPYATCSLEFDMIGLPSLSDLAGGLAGQVCDAIKAVKDQTIDVLIDQINEVIPDELGEGGDFNLDLGQEAGDKIKSAFTPTSNDQINAIPDANGLCYISVPNGQTVTYPCDMLEKTSTVPNTCYLYDENDHNSYERVSCDRYNVAKEACITDWVEDNDHRNSFNPVIQSCAQKNINPLTSPKAACYENGKAIECSKMSNVTRNERMCYNGDGSTTACSNVDQTQQCYGHKDGAFQVLACKEFINNGISSAYDGYVW